MISADSNWLIFLYLPRNSYFRVLQVTVRSSKRLDLTSRAATLKISIWSRYVEFCPKYCLWLIVVMKSKLLTSILALMGQKFRVWLDSTKLCLNTYFWLLKVVGSSKYLDLTSHHRSKSEFWVNNSTSPKDGVLEVVRSSKTTEFSLKFVQKNNFWLTQVVGSSKTMDFNPSAQWPKFLEFLGCTSRGEICKCRFQSQLMMVKNIEFEWILPILRPEKCIFGVYKLWKVCERLDLSSRFHGSKSQFWIDISNSPRNTVLACAEVVGSATTTDFNPWAQRWKKKKKKCRVWVKTIYSYFHMFLFYPTSLPFKHVLCFNSVQLCAWSIHVKTKSVSPKISDWHVGFSVNIYVLPLYWLQRMMCV